jgi:D-glycero-alpha-D-manno-heptose-7-phosphate kinase
MNYKKFFILTKTPLRVSFFGGGTDLPKFYNEAYGQVLSSSVDRYVYTSIKSHDDLFTEDYRLNYSITEHVNGNLKNIKNNLIRKCLEYLKIRENMHITISTDIPSMSGLGSSSSIIVGLLKALHVYKNKKINPKELAEMACKIEINMLKNPIGKQDQYAAVFGGFKSYKFLKKNKVIVEKLKTNVAKKIFRNSMFIWVGNFKESKKILNEQNKEIFKKLKYYKELLNLVTFSKTLINNKKFNLKKFGKMLDKNWSLKKRLSKNISNLKIDQLYKKCLENGAIGGKILGAGSGGFLLILFPENKKEKLKKILKSQKIYYFSESNKGVEVIYKNFY